jgi:hypothetical protein
MRFDFLDEAFWRQQLCGLNFPSGSNDVRRCLYVALLVHVSSTMAECSPYRKRAGLVVLPGSDTFRLSRSKLSK